MPTYQLVIAPAAKSDLKGIYQYGLHRWGESQSDKYLNNFKEQFLVLSEQPLIGTARPDLLLDMRTLPIQSHVVFYRVSANSVEIVRILHGRQDPNRHMK